MVAPINPTQLTPPRVEFIDPRSGAISREWYRFFLSLLTATQTNQQETELAPDTASLLASYDSVFGTAIEGLESAPDCCSETANVDAKVNSLAQAAGAAPPAATESDIAVIQSQLQALALSPPARNGVAPASEGGTGQTSYSDGQLLIGNGSSGGLNKATLTAGSGINVTNGNGSITIAATGGGAGTVTSVDVSGGTTGLSFSGGPVTISGTITMAGTLGVANGGSGATTLTGVVIGNGASAFTTKTNPTGAFVGTTDTQTLTSKRIDPRAVPASATSGTLTINGDTTDLYEAEGLTGAITFAQPTGTPVDGQKLLIRIKDDGTARGITWTTSAGAFRAVGITLPTTTVLSKVTYVGCVYNATDAFWDAVATVTQA
jgi:hypothetical protein